jgi:hypothetical protein
MTNTAQLFTPGLVPDRGAIRRAVLLASSH